MDNICKSVKNKKVLYERCNKKTINNQDFCNYHLKHINKIIYDSNTLNPLDSLNDIDIISLEKIYFMEGTKKVLAREIKPEYLFTYKITVNNKEYQRTLNILTIKDLIESNILIEPFSNVPLTLDIINNAKKQISILKIPQKKISIIEKKKILINNLLSKFENLGYIVHTEWVNAINRFGFIKWYNEVIYLWKDFRNENLELALHIYPNLDLPIIIENSNYIINILTLFNELCTSNHMGTMIVFSGLVWSNENIKQHFPDIFH